MRITTKGQVTIPQEIREQFGLLPNTEVEFYMEKNRVYLKKINSLAKITRGKKLIKKMLRKGDIKISTDEILKLTRDK